NFNTADGGHDGGAALVLVADHAADDGFHVEGVAAHDAALDPFMEEGLDGLLLPFERRLADAREAGIGVQADEEVVPQSRVGEEGLEAGDFHQRSPVDRLQRTAIGLPGDPVAPLSLSGANTNANS